MTPEEENAENYWLALEKRRKMGPDIEKEMLRRLIGDQEAKLRFAQEQSVYYQNVNSDFNDRVRAMGRYLAGGFLPAVMTMVDDLFDAHISIQNVYKSLHRTKVSWPFGAATTLFMASFAFILAIILLTPAYAIPFGQWLAGASGFVPNSIILILLFVFGLLLTSRIDRRRKS